MDGFKTLPKMAHFKVGGSVKSEAYCGGGKAMKKGGDVSDVKQDKAMIKKAFKQHDKAEHDKEPTEIKLKKGGRSKKEAGTVKKFKAGGKIGSDVSKDVKKSSGDEMALINVKPTGDKKASAPSKAAVKPAFGGSDVEKEKSKPAGDKDTIKKVKPTGDKKADAPNKAAEKPSRLGKLDAVDDINGYKEGKKIKKFQVGGLTGPVSDMEKRKKMEQARMAALMAGQQQMPPAPPPNAQMLGGAGQAPQPQMPPQGMPGQLPPGMGQ